MAERTEHNQEGRRDVEGNLGAITEVYRTVGDVLGWKNASSDIAKVADIELLSATGYDAEFVATHHRVRDLLEANQVFKTGKTPAEIYASIENKHPLMVKVSLAGGEKEADLRVLAQFLRVKEANRLLGKYRLPERDLQEKFFNGAELKIATKGSVVDLRADCPLDTMEDFDWQGYMKIIKENQVGLQFLGGLRDASLKKHHIENAEHTLFIKTGKKEANGASEILWMPVSQTISAVRARVDVPKVGQRFRSAGHVHEIGAYDEYTGSTVKVDRALLKGLRGDLTTDKVHEETNSRMYNAAVGLQKEEESMTYEENGMDVIDIGKNHKGMIYEALHNTYDKAMIEKRGYGLEQDEADDMIFTDIIAPFLVVNPRDWAMCLAKAANVGSYKSLNAARGDKWSDHKFCVKLRCKDVDHPDRNRTHTFSSMEEILEYLNQRIAMGDIEGVEKKVAPTLSKQEEEEDEESGTDENGEAQKDLTNDQLRLYPKLFQSLFGDNTVRCVEQYANKGLKKGVISVDKKRVDLLEFLKQKLKGVEDRLLLELTGASGDKGRNKIIAFLDKLSEDNRKKLFDQVRSLASKK